MSTSTVYITTVSFVWSVPFSNRWPHSIVHDYYNNSYLKNHTVACNGTNSEQTRKQQTNQWSTTVAQVFWENVHMHSWTHLLFTWSNTTNLPNRYRLYRVCLLHGRQRAKVVTEQGFKGVDRLKTPYEADLYWLVVAQRSLCQNKESLLPVLHLRK